MPRAMVGARSSAASAAPNMSAPSSADPDLDRSRDRHGRSRTGIAHERARSPRPPLRERGEVGKIAARTGYDPVNRGTEQRRCCTVDRRVAATPDTLGCEMRGVPAIAFRSVALRACAEIRYQTPAVFGRRSGL